MNFNEIRGNALANKNDFNELAELARQMSSEKANFSSVVAWFRNRKRMLSRSFEPIKNSMNTKKNDEIEEMEVIIQYAERALSLTEDQELESAWKFIDRIESYYEMDLGLKSNSPQEQLANLEEALAMYQNTLKDLVDQSGDTQILNNRIERTESMILDVKHAKDLDISTINSDIYIWNDTLDRLDLDVPHLEPVPDNYNRERVEQLKTQMRGVLGRLRNRYYLNIFIKPFQIAKKIAHDISEDRGQRAFDSRYNELIAANEEAVDIFNKKYWQITGNRWQRISTNRCGYVSVAPTHDPI